MMLKRIVLPALMAMLALPTVLNADTAVTNNGDINNDATWTLGAAPIAGDTQQWDTGTLTLRTVTQTWEGQELRVQTGGRLASGGPGPTLTMNGDLTLDGGTITVLNNNPFTIDLQNNNFTLNSGKLDSGSLTATRNLIFANGLLQGSGTIFVEGGNQVPTTNRTDVIFQDSVDTTGFTGVFNVDKTANFFLPEIAAADASFGIEVQGSGQIGLTKNIAVTSAVFDGTEITPGTYTRQQLIDDFAINTNRVLAAGASGTLTVVSGTTTILGDVNLSGTVDFSDITPFIEALSSTEFQAEADCNQDSVVDFSDITPFIAILTGP